MKPPPLVRKKERIKFLRFLIQETSPPPPPVRMAWWVT